MNDLCYPVAGRGADRNLRIAGHEVGHAVCSRAVGDIVHLVTIIRGGGYEGKCVRSGPPSSLVFADQDSNEPSLQPDEVISICEKLEALGGPEIGESRIATAEYYVRGLNNCIGLLGGEACEMLLHSDQPSLGAVHDFEEAKAFAKITTFTSPAVTAMIEYARAEAVGILSQNLDVARALVAALVEVGQLSGARVDEIIADTIAARAVEAEKIRRADWHKRQRNAATFLKTLPR
jgi:hypothetical protein